MKMVASLSSSCAALDQQLSIRQLPAVTRGRTGASYGRRKVIEKLVRLSLASIERKLIE